MSNTKKRFEDLDLLDNFLMNEVTTDQIVGEDTCRSILSVLLQRKIGKIRVITQKNMPPIVPGHRGIVMDVEVEEQLNYKDTFPNMNIYDIEPHRKPHETEDLPRRIRFYQSKIDGRKLSSGERNFSRLPNLYIVNILDYDPFGYDQVCYTIEAECKEVPELLYEDGLHILYFNTTGTQGGNKAITNMLRFLDKSTKDNAVDDSTKILYDYVHQVKEDAKARDRYMTWSEMIDYEVEEAKQEARKEGHVKSLLIMIGRKLVKGKSLSEIAEDLEESPDVIRPLYELASQYAPDYDVDKMYEAYRK